MSVTDRATLPLDASIANADDRRTHMETDVPHRQCSTCVAIVPRSNAGTLVESDCGACFRIAFLMSGMAKLEDTDLKNKARAETRNRPTKEQRDELLNDTYRWWDITDIRNKQYYCRHHTHALTMAPEFFAHFGDSFENYREFTPPLLTKWFDDGMPLVPHKPVKLSNAMLPPPEDNMPQIPDAYLEGYNPCANCTHFLRETDEATGVAIPHKGKCTNGARNKGALQLLANEERDTYSFLSCNQFHMNPARVQERAERPGQLFGFAELNPMHEDPARLYDFYAHLPRAFLPAPLSEEELEVLDNHDLVLGVQSRMDEIDHLSFNKDMSLMPVASHFARRIKENSKKEAEHWSRYAHYTTVGASIYDATDEQPTAENN